jgi:hypothetical protein
MSSLIAPSTAACSSAPVAKDVTVPIAAADCVRWRAASAPRDAASSSSNMYKVRTPHIVVQKRLTGVVDLFVFLEKTFVTCCAVYARVRACFWLGSADVSCEGASSVHCAVRDTLLRSRQEGGCFSVLRPDFPIQRDPWMLRVCEAGEWLQVMAVQKATTTSKLGAAAACDRGKGARFIFIFRSVS